MKLFQKKIKILKWLRERLYNISINNIYNKKQISVIEPRIIVNGITINNVSLTHWGNL